MTELTANERHALAAIANAAETTTGDRSEGWWSAEILMYSKHCPLSPREFASACGSLAKKGFTFSQEHEPREWHIRVTDAGLKALDRATLSNRVTAP